MLGDEDIMALSERCCIIVCNFNDKERKLIKTFGSMMGIKDQINVSWKNSNTLIKDILENNIDDKAEDGLKDKAIIFNAVPQDKLNMFLEKLHKMKMPPVMKAVVTEFSNEWSLNYLLEHLIEERRAAKKGNGPVHKLK